MGIVEAQRTGVAYIIESELGCKEIDRGRAVYEKFVCEHSEVRNWIKFSVFEERHVFTAQMHGVYLNEKLSTLEMNQWMKIISFS